MEVYPGHHCHVILNHFPSPYPEFYFKMLRTLRSNEKVSGSRAGGGEGGGQDPGLVFSNSETEVGWTWDNQMGSWLV